MQKIALTAIGTPRFLAIVSNIECETSARDDYEVVRRRIRAHGSQRDPERRREASWLLRVSLGSVLGPTALWLLLTIGPSTKRNRGTFVCYRPDGLPEV